MVRTVPLRTRSSVLPFEDASARTYSLSVVTTPDRVPPPESTLDRVAYSADT